MERRVLKILVPMPILIKFCKQLFTTLHIKQAGNYLFLKLNVKHAITEFIMNNFCGCSIQRSCCWKKLIGCFISISWWLIDCCYQSCRGASEIPPLFVSSWVLLVTGEFGGNWRKNKRFSCLQIGMTIIYIHA